MPLLILAMLFGWLLLDPLRAQDVPSPLTRIAFGSCADEEKPQPIWNVVLAYQPQLFLFGGDNVYGDLFGGDNVYGDVRQGRDVPDGELIQSLQESYAQAAQVSGMAWLRSTIPHLATWDDHDYGKNDAGAEFAGRHEAQRLFLQFWGQRKNCSH
jgi:alkaline phosphatase D